MLTGMSVSFDLPANGKPGNFADSNGDGKRSVTCTASSRIYNLRFVRSSSEGGDANAQLL